MTMLGRNIDWPKYLKRALPIAFRSLESHLEIIGLWATMLAAINTSLVAFRNLMIAEYKGSGQRLVLERILRVRLTGGAALIWIVNSDETKERYDLYPRNRTSEVVYGYTHSELAAAEGSLTGYIYTRAEEYDDDVVDFTVEVDSTLWASLSNEERRLLTRLVDRFKLYGTTYQIIQI